MDTSPERFLQLADGFEDLAAISPGPAREERLKKIRETDTGLWKELCRLLRSDEEVARRMGAPAQRPVRFGAYEARELIGSGGMGAVYRATREDGEVRHEAAVKVISHAQWSPYLEERFRRERQILAELAHPNIAGFLDGGIAGDGSLYLVMEFVDGERMDLWCDRHRLPVNERLRLFLKVCSAVSFAHQRLIVHRDLKPGNILIRNDGEPKLLDFGIARTLEPAGAPNSAATNALFLTPLYSSPELLRGQASGVGCDVYSLGVLLYELLTGTRPFGSSGMPPMEVASLVLTQDALPPSVAVAASAKELSRALRGDLDAIIEKAIAKSPAGRYQSVEQFAADIRRHLDGYPVQALAPGGLYRARKFLARNRAGVLAAAIVVLAIAAGFAGVLWQAQVARQERAAAERRFTEARELSRYLVFELQTEVAKLPGATPLRAAMVARSLAYLDRLAAEKSNNDDLKLEVARGYMQLADVLGNPFLPNIGEPVKARESYRKAISILEPLAARHPDQKEARVNLARSKLMMGRGLGFNSDSREGKKLIEDAGEEFGRLAARWPDDFQVRLQAAIAYDTLARSRGLAGGSYVSGATIQPALEANRLSIENGNAALRLKPSSFDAIRLVSMDYKVLGDYTELSDRPAATKYFRQAIAMLDRMSPGDRETPGGRGARASALLGLGWNLGNLGQYSEALAALEEARAIRDRLAEDDPKNRNAEFFRTIPYRNLALVNHLAGREAESLRNFRAAIAVYDNLLATTPQSRNYMFSRAEMQVDAADACIRLGRKAEGAQLAAAGVAVLKSTASRPDANPVELAIAARALMECKALPLRDFKLALSFSERAAAGSDDAEVSEILGEAYWLNGDRARAVAAVTRALSRIEQKPTPVRQSLEKTLNRYRTAPLASSS